jgi:hypothetical protein
MTMKIRKIMSFAAVIALTCSCYEDYVKDYDYDAVTIAYQYNLRSFVVGEGMKFQIGTMLSGVMANTRDRHVDIIMEHWDEILGFMDEELPPFEEVYDLMKELGMPMTPQEIGFTAEDTREAFMGARDIRDKYICSTLIWEMGLLEEIGDKLKAYVEAGCPREWN